MHHLFDESDGHFLPNLFTDFPLAARVRRRVRLQRVPRQNPEYEEINRLLGWLLIKSAV